MQSGTEKLAYILYQMRNNISFENVKDAILTYFSGNTALDKLNVSVH